MVRAHLFSYALIDTSALEGADFYIVPASKAEEYAESFYEITDTRLGEEFYKGKSGIKVYDAATGRGAAMRFLGYPNEDCLLFIGANSLHNGSEGALDDSVYGIVRAFLKLD